MLDITRTILLLITILPLPSYQAQSGLTQDFLCPNLSMYQVRKILKEGKPLVISATRNCTRKSASLQPGSVLRVTYLTTPGYLEIDDRVPCHQRNGDCSIRWTGYIPDIFNHLAESLDFTYHLQYSRDGKFGTKDNKSGKQYSCVVFAEVRPIKACSFIPLKIYQNLGWIQSFH